MRCSYGVAGCKGDRVLDLLGWIGHALTEEQVRLEAGSRRRRGQLCDRHAGEVKAIGLAPTRKTKTLRSSHVVA